MEVDKKRENDNSEAVPLIPREQLQPLLVELDLQRIPESFEGYRSLLKWCLKRDLYRPVFLLLEEHPFMGHTDQHIQTTINLVYNQVFDNLVNSIETLPSECLNTKIALFRFIARSYALGSRGGELRSFLEKFIEQRLVDLEINPSVVHDIQYRIHLLIHQLAPEVSGDLLPLPPTAETQIPSTFSKKVATAYKTTKFAGTLLWNHKETRAGSEYKKHNFIDDNVILGMYRGSKGGLEIIRDFKKKGKELTLVVTCLEDHEKNFESNRAFTAGNPAFWRNMSVQQIQVPAIDFTKIITDKEMLFEALNLMHEVNKADEGFYIHCKAGKGRSAMVLVIFYVLFSTSLTGDTLELRIEAAYKLLQDARKQVIQDVTYRSAVRDYVLEYMSSNFQHPDVYHVVQRHVTVENPVDQPNL